MSAHTLMPSWGHRFAVVVLMSWLAGTGCFSSPKIDVGTIQCEIPDDCPSGYVCKIPPHRCCMPSDSTCGIAALDGSLADAEESITDGSAATTATGGTRGLDAAASGGAGGSRTGIGGNGGHPSSPDATFDIPIALPDGATPLGPGSPCSADGDCALGNCVNGVCCNKSKAECSACNACTNAATGLDDGACGPVSAGKDVNSACADETGTNQCGNDGTCDGKGACRKVSSSHVCTKASCSADGKVFTPETTCNGDGACTAAKTQLCAPFLCATTGCQQTCTVQSDCTGTYYCNTAVTPSVCATRKTNGQPATQRFECSSDNLVDGVCCDVANCSGCSACTVALNKQPGALDGKCLPVLLGEAGHGTCVANPPCGLDGKCDGNGACRYPTTGTSCAASGCTSDLSRSVSR